MTTLLVQVGVGMSKFSAGGEPHPPSMENPAIGAQVKWFPMILLLQKAPYQLLQQTHKPT